MLLKTKMYSLPLSKEEIVDVKKTLRSKGKIYKTPEELIRDLHTNVASQQKTTPRIKYISILFTPRFFILNSLNSLMTCN